ncbi:phytoene desaturase family protein [Fredinandcohnia humi]
MNGRSWDCVVVGGGIAGLTASIFLARVGKSVVVIEKSKELGGRGRTIEKNGAFLNLGPHALYSKGSACKILDELGIRIEGGKVPVSGKLISNGMCHDIPGDPLKLIKSPLLSWKAKKELINFFIKYKKIDTESIRNISLQTWLQQKIKDQEAQKLIMMLVRLSSYSGESELLSAGAALKQLQLGNVIYLHYGWQTMINQLRDEAIAAGVTFMKNKRVGGIKGVSPNIEVLIQEQDTLYAETVLLAVSPQDVISILSNHENNPDLSSLEKLVSVRAACLDVVLKEVPNPDISFAMGLEEPFYYSNHSRVAKLSADGRDAVVHVMKYIGTTDQVKEEQVYGELTTFLDTIQPGWEKAVSFKRYLPRMSVSNGLVMAKNGGLQGRPTPSVLQIPGLYVAGDWVGNKGMLVDACFESAREAAGMICEI